MIQDWCIQHNKILDTQNGLYPGRSTLQPLFILRHAKHAAQRMQSGSSRLYAAFIDFKQANDCIPRKKLCGHLRSCRMPDHILPGIRHLKRLVSCWWINVIGMGIRQLLCSHLLVLNKDAPSPLCCSPSTWMTLIALQTGWKARSPVLQFFWWPTCCLQMTSASTSSNPNHMQTMLNKLRA